MPEIKVLISKETHAKLRKAQRLAGISEQRLAVGAALEYLLGDFEYHSFDRLEFDLEQAMMNGLSVVRKEVLRELAK